MTTSITDQATSGQASKVTTRTGSSDRVSGTVATTGGAELVTTHGRTTIADAVVAKIAGVAAREISGVHAMGSGAARAFGAIRERIPGSAQSLTQGVAVEVGEKQAAIDLDIVVEYGVAMIDLATAVRRNVITAVERMTGLSVVEVNIAVDDVYIPGEDESTAEARVK